VIVIDEYLAVRVAGGDWPDGHVDSEDLVLPMSRHWRLLQPVHAPRGGNISQIMGTFHPDDALTALRVPHPEVLQILDPRPLLGEAAQLGLKCGGGWLIDETLAAGLDHGRTMWFGSARDVCRLLASAADDLGISIHITG